MEEKIIYDVLDIINNFEIMKNIRNSSEEISSQKSGGKMEEMEEKIFNVLFQIIYY
jgi:hypothetical protein